MIFNIVDIETSGVVDGRQRITEVAVIKFDGKKEIDRFVSLVNPGVSIPPFITRLTGIDNETVRESPSFSEVSKELLSFLEEGVFVAHNVSFDYNIIKREMSEAGKEFSSKKLCTVKLSRKFIPGHSSYSLGKICNDLGIVIKNRHRAMGDAEATVKLLAKIINFESQEVVLENIAVEKKRKIPRHIDQDLIDNLPESRGVYFIKNHSGKMIYIGKSQNIRKRIITHLQSSKLLRRTKLELRLEAKDFNFILIENELACSLVEAFEIKKHRPSFNRSMNRLSFKYAVKTKMDGKKIVLKVSTVIDQTVNSALMFRSRSVAVKKISGFYREAFGVSPENSHFDTFKNKLEGAAWNLRIESVLNDYAYPSDNFTLSWNLINECKGEIKITENFMESISWYDGQGNLLKEYLIDEDPDLKRMLTRKLSKIKNSPSYNIKTLRF